MQEELSHFERKEVWGLVPRLKDHSIIGTKWVYKDIIRQKWHILINKVRLVVQG